MPLEQVNIKIGVSGWFRPINVTVLLNNYPVPSQVYDAGSILYVSFLMLNGKPEDLSLRVIAKDSNQTNTADSVMTIKRVESAEIKMLMENITAIRTKLDSLEDIIIQTTTPRLDTIIALENELRDLLAMARGEISNVNSSVLTKVSNVAFELRQEFEALRNELASLKMDTADVKALATGINEATHNGNVIVANLQSQVAWLQKTVYAVAVLSSLSLVLVAVLIYRSKASMPSLKQPLQKPQVASWRSVRKEEPSEPSKQLEPMSKEQKLIRRIRN